MGIVLNESDYAAHAVATSSLGKKPSETLRRVARYYMDYHKINDKKAVQAKLGVFLLQCDPTASIPKWSPLLEFATNWASKHEAVNIDGISITKPELSTIDALPGRQIRRLAFVLICLAKYWNTVNRCNDNWVNSRDHDVMAFANVNTSIRRQCAMYTKLHDLGLIQFSKKVDNTNVRVCFLCDGETALVVRDLRNLGYQYMKYHGAPYFECENCGATTKLREPSVGRKQKYCEECAVEIKTKQSVNSVMRRRASTNEDEKIFI